MNIAWILTEVMGGAMAGHLLAAGHALTVFSRTKSKAEELLRRGACWADSPQEAVPGAEAVCVMVGYPADVDAVILGSEGVLPAMSRESLLVDFITSPEPGGGDRAGRRRAGNNGPGRPGVRRRYRRARGGALDHGRRE